MITRLEGWLLLGLYGFYLVEQVLAATSGGEMVDTFRFVVLVAVLPVLLVFLVWQGLRWRQQRQLPAAISD